MKHEFCHDPLEPRRLLAAALNGSTLSIEGTAAGEGIQVGIYSPDDSLLVVLIGQQQNFFPRAGIDKVRVFADDGDDTISIFSGGSVNFEIPITVYGGNGGDFIGGDLPSTALFRGYGEAGRDTIRITGQSRDYAYGGADDDIIGTNGGRDYLSGEAGDDNLNAGSGNDKAFGGIGNDVINGGEGSVDAPNKDTLDGGPGDDNISGKFSNDTITGGDGNDNIYGGDARDLIDGGLGTDTIHADAGNDSIDGGVGADVLFGGGDADLFIAAERDAGEVQDFEAGLDAVA